MLVGPVVVVGVGCKCLVVLLIQVSNLITYNTALLLLCEQTIQIWGTRLS